jgi:hypothetical protein
MKLYPDFSMPEDDTSQKGENTTLSWSLTCEPEMDLQTTSMRDMGWTVADEILYQDWLNEGPYMEDS